MNHVGTGDEVYERVIRFLARRAHSRAELLRKLKQRGVSSQLATGAINRAEAEGYVDDLEFARTFARQSRDLKSWAPRRTRLELGKRGVSMSHQDQAVGEVYNDIELLELARACARKRATRLSGDTPSRRRRLADFLTRRGYPTAITRAALDDVAPYQ